MVLITAVYVIATIVITVANIKAAKATRAQIAESRWQYEDKKRLEVKPYIQFERILNAPKACYRFEGYSMVEGCTLKPSGEVLQVKNIGLGTAKDITCSFQWDDETEECKTSAFPVQALYSNETQFVYITLYHPSTKDKTLSGCFTLEYSDLLDNKYSQRIDMSYLQQDAHLSLQEIKVFSPVQIKKENNNA